MKCERVDHVGMVVAGNAEAASGPEADTEKDRVEFALEIFKVTLRANLRAGAKLHAEVADQLDLAHAGAGRQLVFGHAVGVQPARQRAPLEDGDSETALAQLRRAGQRGRSGADAGDLLPPLVVRISRQRAARSVEDVHGKALQEGDLDRLAIVAMHHAGALAQHLHGTRA